MVPARKLVEGVLSELGLSPDENRLPTQGESLAWGLMKGSAEVFIFINLAKAEGDPAPDASIQVVSPVMKLPESAANQTALFRRLLELNAQLLSGAAFGLRGDTVVLISDRSTRDLTYDEVKEMILRVGYFADQYDDDLVGQFGGRRASE